MKLLSGGERDYKINSRDFTRDNIKGLKNLERNRKSLAITISVCKLVLNNKLNIPSYSPLL